ncbi:MAG TPA: winged helix-turn-helix transcriptional regulator [Gemmatimonadales bacterium]
MTNWVERLTGETTSKLLALLRRSGLTITALADALHLTDNAVRTHIAALERDGIVEHVGTQRETGGKPARLYGLTRDGEELFPKAYALVLGALVEEIARVEGWERATALLRAVGQRAASGAAAPADRDGRVAAAAAALGSLGGDVEVQRTERGYTLQGYGCPLSAVTAKHPEVCALARALVEEITGEPVTECCDRNGRPRCGFRIDSGPDSQRAVARLGSAP